MPKAGTVSEYLASLPSDKRSALAAVRNTIRDNIPDGYEEYFIGGMMAWCIPLSRLPDTYNARPLFYVALAAQKNYNSLYMMSVYSSDANRRAFEAGFKRAGKKLDMGKSCVRFTSADDLPLDFIGSTIAAMPAEKWIDIYRASRARPARTTPRKP